MASHPQIDLSSVLEHLAVSIRDEDAWCRLYALLWPYVLSICSRRLIRAPSIAEDAAQEVFIRLLHYCPFERLQAPHLFLSYVRKVVEHVCIDLSVRAAQTAAAVESIGKSVGSSPGSIESDISLRAKIRTLPKEERSLAELIIKGYTVGEIAEVLRIPYSATAVKIHRLRNRLREG